MAFQIYLSSLFNTGQKASINPAVRRRESILAGFPDSTRNAQSTSSGVSALASDGSFGTTLASGATGLPPQPSSQDIAQVVLSGQSDLAVSPPATSSPDLTKFASAVEANGSASPIQVSIIERKLPQPYAISRTVMFVSISGKGAWVPRMIRFVSLVLVSSFCKSTLTQAVSRLILPSFRP